MSYLFAFAADLHLDDHVWAAQRELVGDAEESLRQIVDFCRTNRCPLLLGGDIINIRRPSAPVMVTLYREFDRMEAAGLRVYFIQGQHELSRTLPWLNVHPWPQHVHDQRFVVNGVSFYALDWLPRGQLQEKLQAMAAATHRQAPTVMMCHQVWEEFMGVGRTDGRIADIPYVNYLLTGDLHEHRVEDLPTETGQRITVYSSGSTCMQRIDEPPQKAFFAFTQGPEGLQGHSIPLNTRDLLAYRLTTQVELDQFCTDAERYLHDYQQNEARTKPPAIAKPIVVVRFRDDLPDAHGRITQAVGQAGFLFLLPSDTITNAAVNLDQVYTDDAAVDLLDAVSAQLPVGSGAYNLLRVMLADGVDPEDVLKREYEAYMAGGGTSEEQGAQGG